jgi:hypothetical protein
MPSRLVVFVLIIFVVIKTEQIADHSSSVYCFSRRDKSNKPWEWRRVFLCTFGAHISELILADGSTLFIRNADPRLPEYTVS